MKKLFVSVPMRGRTRENIEKSIEKMHKIAEVCVGEKLELIPSYIKEAEPQGNEKIWYLGESIKKMAGADYFAFIDYCYDFTGCSIERDVARYYMGENQCIPIARALVLKDVPGEVLCVARG